MKWSFVSLYSGLFASWKEIERPYDTRVWGRIWLCFVCSCNFMYTCNACSPSRFLSIHWSSSPHYACQSFPAPMESVEASLFIWHDLVKKKKTLWSYTLINPFYTSSIHFGLFQILSNLPYTVEHLSNPNLIRSGEERATSKCHLLQNSSKEF